MYVSTQSACLVPTDAEVGRVPSELDLMDECEPPCVCQEPNPGFLQEKQVLVNTEPSLQPDAFVCSPLSNCSDDSNLPFSFWNPTFQVMYSTRKELQEGQVAV